MLDPYHVIETPDWSCVLAITTEGAAVLVEQYRHPIGRVALELPAGVLDPGETPSQAAARELLEETGYRAATMDPLGRLAMEPGRLTGYGHLFVARDATRVAEPSLDISEDISVRLVPVASLPGRIAAGEMVHAVHVAAVFWAMAQGAFPSNPSAPAAY